MLKSINQWIFNSDRSLPEIFALAKLNGFDAVELTIDEIGPLSIESTKEECDRISDQARSVGILISSVASGLGWKYPITAEDVELRKHGIRTAARCIEITRWLGVDTMLLVPGGVGAEFIDGFPITPYDRAYDNALAALKELAPIAERHGVAVGVENVWNKFLFSPLEFRVFLDQCSSRWICSYFDVANIVSTGYPEHWVSILGHRIRRVHIKDFKRATATLDGFCDLLDGDVNFPAVMASLRAIGYDGFVTAEYFVSEEKLSMISEAMDKILSMKSPVE